MDAYELLVGSEFIDKQSQNPPVSEKTLKTNKIPADEYSRQNTLCEFQDGRWEGSQHGSKVGHKGDSAVM